MSETPTEPAVEPVDEPLEEPVLEPADDEPADEPLEPAADEPTEPEAGEAPSTQELLKALESEHGRHQRAVAKALGIDPAEMHECPTCEGVGWTPEQIGREVPLKQDPFTETCERCDGNGRTLSGATHLGMYEIPCGDCTGSGYKQKQEYPDAGAGFGERPAGDAYVPPPARPPAADDPVLAELRSRGYTILEPIVVPQPVPA